MYSPRTPYSRSQMATGKFGSARSSGSFLNSPMRPLTAVTASPRNQSFNRSLNASIIDETRQHSVLMYGSPMPVLVTEAITTVERITDISVRLDELGWASLVCGRRLFIWKYKQDPNTWNPTVHCRELILPPSDLAHKAELVRIFINKDTQVLCALAVSPEGMVRFWPNIVHEAMSIEATTDFQGQECHSLTTIHPLKYILATTTGTLVLITISNIDGQFNVICHTLREPQGVFAGIGRKVSSFIFGGLPTQSLESKQLNKVVSLSADSDGEYYLYVLSSCTLQKWHLLKDVSDKLLFEHDLERFLKEHFMKTLWAFSDSTQLHSLKFWCLDIQLMQNGVLILTAAVNVVNSQFMHYAFISFSNADSNNGMNFSSFSVLKHCEIYQAGNEEKLLSYKFFFLPAYRLACVYSMEKVLLVPFTDENQEQDLLDVSRCGNILGAGICDAMPLFFAYNTGVLAIQFNSPAFLDTSIQSPPPEKQILIKEPQETEAPDSLISKLRSAMSLYFNYEIEKCQEVIREIFPESSFQTTNAELDKAVVLLSKQIIDDYPVSDPRWCDSVPKGDSVSSSLIILHQLDDKLKAHGYVISFFKAHHLFDKLCTVKDQNGIVSTKMLLCEHEEKVIAAKSIRQFLVTYNEILDAVIKETLISRNIALRNQLTYQDMYFREVSTIDILFSSLIVWEENKLSKEINDAVNIVTTINTILIGVLQAVLQYRQNKKTVFNVPDPSINIPFQPWTSGEGPKGLRTVITQQISINMQYTLKVSDDVQFQGAVYQQIVDLVDILLDGYISQLKSLEGTNEHSSLEGRFKNERNKVIRPLLEMSQYERAASLAEKYLDFDILVQLCEDTQNEERLQRYILQFKEHGFSDFMFKWYLDKGMRNKLLIQPFGQHEDLSRFLKGHDALSWLHDINNRRYDSAQQTLRELTLKENNVLNKKKTLCSLGKLAALASDLPSNIKNHHVEALNLELDLIAHQENLPDTVAEAFGLDPDTMRVLIPEELIEMYICDENISANCYDFKIALELLQFVKSIPGDNDYENLRCHIWCRAILRDNWEEMDTNNPIEAIKETVFFQVIELAFDQGVDLHEFIVPVDDLLQSSELSGLVDCNNFNFLLRAGYEYVLKLIE